MNRAARREHEIREKFRPFEERFLDLVERAHLRGIPDTKYSPRAGVDTHWFNSNEGGLIEIDERYVPTEQLLEGELAGLVFDISNEMQLREAGSRNWDSNLKLRIKQLRLWSVELERAGAPHADLTFLGKVLARLICAGVER